MSENEKRSFKVVLLGNSGVGKTSLVSTWTIGVFNETIKPTIGANHQKKTVNVEGEDVDLFIWDTAGQEQFHALTPLYVKSASCAIFVASITDLESFKALNDWIDIMRSSCERTPPLILAVNKIDLEKNKTISSETIEKKCRSMFNTIFYVSAATGERVDELFTHAAILALHFDKQSPSNQPTLQKVEEKKNCC